MRAGLRWTSVLLAGGLSLSATTGLAQSTSTAPATSSQQPTTNAIGPSELQNFSLPGSVTRPSEQQASPAPNATPPSPTVADTARAAPPPVRRTVESPRAVAEGVGSRAADTAKLRSAPQSTPLPVAPTLAPQTSTAPTAAPTAAFPTVPAPVEPPATALAPEHKLALWPWILAAAALAGGTLFLLWRRRAREVLAGAPQFDVFVPPERPPSPAPVAQPLPRAAVPDRPRVPASPPAAAAKGIVSTRLRPQVEIAVQPLRCLVDDERVVLDFEIELFNAGAAPARSVTAEASLFNPGPTQEQDLAAFFAKPAGVGDRLDVLDPMKRVTFTSQVVAPRAAVQEYELAGRTALVPVIAFNALYEWSGGPAQTSAAYLVGRETKSEKLGPLPVNGTAREFRALAARVLPTALRT